MENTCRFCSPDTTRRQNSRHSIRISLEILDGPTYFPSTLFTCSCRTPWEPKMVCVWRCWIFRDSIFMLDKAPPPHILHVHILTRTTYNTWRYLHIHTCMCCFHWETLITPTQKWVYSCRCACAVTQYSDWCQSASHHWQHNWGKSNTWHSRLWPLCLSVSS